MSRKSPGDSIGIEFRIIHRKPATTCSTGGHRDGRHASLILGLVWAVWHLPLLQSSLAGIAVYMLLEIVPFAILFTAVFNRSGGSLLLAILLHSSINFGEMLMPPSTVASIVIKLLILALAIWMGLRPRDFTLRGGEGVGE